MSIASLVPSVTVPLTPSLAAHSVTALRYRHYSGPVDLSPLVIRQERRFAWGQAQVSAYILGASHALTVELPDGETFTELLTCLPPHPAPEGSLEKGNDWLIPATGGKWETEFSRSGIRGTVCLHHTALTPDSETLRLALSPHDTLHEPFPLPNGDTAWTRVAWRIEAQRLFLETIHTYPEDGAAVRSATCLFPGPVRK